MSLVELISTAVFFLENFTLPDDPFFGLAR